MNRMDRFSGKNLDLGLIVIDKSELRELLARLASEDALMGQGEPTIHDVAEATGASNELIGRILGEMRGATLVEELQERVAIQEARIGELESAVAAPHRAGSKPISTEEFEEHLVQVQRSRSAKQAPYIILFLIIVLIIALSSRQLPRGGYQEQVPKYGRWGDEPPFGMTESEWKASGPAIEEAIDNPSNTGPKKL